MDQPSTLARRQIPYWALLALALFNIHAAIAGPEPEAMLISQIGHLQNELQKQKPVASNLFFAKETKRIPGHSHNAIQGLLPEKFRFVIANPEMKASNKLEIAAQKIIDTMHIRMFQTDIGKATCLLSMSNPNFLQRMFGLSSIATQELLPVCLGMEIENAEDISQIKTILEYRPVRRHVFILVEGKEPFTSHTLPDNTVLYVFSQTATITTSELARRMAHEIGLTFDNFNLIGNYFMDHIAHVNGKFVALKSRGDRQELVCALHNDDLRLLLKMARAFAYESNLVGRMGYDSHSIPSIQPPNSTCKQRLNILIPFLQELKPVNDEYRNGERMHNRYASEDRCERIPDLPEAVRILTSHILYVNRDEFDPQQMGPFWVKNLFGTPENDACNFFSFFQIGIDGYQDSQGPRPRIGGGSGSGSGTRNGRD